MTSEEEAGDDEYENESARGASMYEEEKRSSLNTNIFCSSETSPLTSTPPAQNYEYEYSRGVGYATHTTLL